jgi:Flp pilus assembly protein TadG
MNIAGKYLNGLKADVLDFADRFRKDCEGVAALEFALIAPIMIMLFVGTLEVSAAVSVNRKVSRISSVVGDLVTQSSDLDASEISNIMDVASDIMEPYSNTVKIRITGIEIASGNATVTWSCHKSWTKANVGSAYTVPPNIKTNGTNLVAARVQTVYQPMVGWVRYNAPTPSGSSSTGISFENTSVTMDEEIFLRPRKSSTINVSC